jgi:hypothetical protein
MSAAEYRIGQTTTVLGRLGPSGKERAKSNKLNETRKLAGFGADELLAEFGKPKAIQRLFAGARRMVCVV